MKKEIFTKEYDWESLYDFWRDMHECLDPNLNPKMVDIDGEFPGTIKVEVSYHKEQE